MELIARSLARALYCFWFLHFLCKRTPNPNFFDYCLHPTFALYTRKRSYRVAQCRCCRGFVGLLACLYFLLARSACDLDRWLQWRTKLRDAKGTITKQTNSACLRQQDGIDGKKGIKIKQKQETATHRLSTADDGSSCEVSANNDVNVEKEYFDWADDIEESSQTFEPAPPADIHEALKAALENACIQMGPKEPG